MNTLGFWGEAIAESLVSLWSQFIAFLPGFVGALVVFLIGIGIAVALGKIATKIFKLIKVDELTGRLGLAKISKKAGIEISISRFVGWLVKWFLVIVFLLAATDILGLEQVSNFLGHVLAYIPHIVVATVILVVAAILANFLYRVVRASIGAAKVPYARLIATIVQWAVLIFGFLAALVQLQIAVSLINTLFTGLVAMLALAGGIAFGLGGKDAAGEILSGLRKKLSSNKNQ